MGIAMRLYIKIRRKAMMAKLKFMSSRNVHIKGEPILNQPLLVNGEGAIEFGEKVRLGYEYSPYFHNTYIYMDLRGPGSLIRIGDGVMLNNNASLTADEASIHIGKNTIAGVNLSIQTSDGHCLSPDIRNAVNFPRYSVIIGENVFIGDNVTILKGVNIGKNSVIGAGSVVTHAIPENVMAAGNPCQVIRPLS
jgi:maltose O-acetyltransferase